MKMKRKYKKTTTKRNIVHDGYFVSVFILFNS